MGKRQAILVVGLGYGDEGKGSLVDYLVRETHAHTVVRYNGGAQAAHNVIDARGRHHTFAQFGSGMFVPGTRTHLSRYMMVEPMSLFKEEEHLRALGIRDALARLSIDRRALITTPYHQAANRLREMARGSDRHGSCGRGVGETMWDYVTYGDRVLFAGDLAERGRALDKLRFIRETKLASLHDVLQHLHRTPEVDRELNVLTDASYDEFCADGYGRLVRAVQIVDEGYFRGLTEVDGALVFEGAQGALLDEWYGFHPYTTWSTTTLKNAYELLNEQGYDGEIVRLGALRAYSTRHGSGPFVTEDSHWGRLIPDRHNGLNDWQREFRVGPLDLVATRYALDIIGGVDYIAATNFDRLAQVPSWRVCDAYCYAGSVDDTMRDHFEQGQDGALVRIKRSPVIDLDYQAQLTDLLAKCEPRYRLIERGRVDAQEDLLTYIEMMEQGLGTPIGIISHGPKAQDKQRRKVNAF
ncbi:MAG: adenylosuccinate synthetase [Anaerolineae bacterium]